MTIDTRKTPAERRADARREAVVNNVTKLAANLALLPVQAWILMLALGAVHSVVAPVAAVGYGTSLLFILGFDVLSDLMKKFRK
ncbi:hypothetical protein [Streptomyces sp. NPDC058272]|uniref:hypothetical protein n=1 Tax=Streptomyces sp. NPDC058272 TaxID=3346415 RepID=UPI0036E7DACD